MNNIGIRIPRILLPKKGINLEKWAVVAVDQYTSNAEYWQRLEKHIGDDASTLRLVLPEIYLEGQDVLARIETINRNMQNYLERDMFEQVDGMVYIERTLPGGRVRKGLMVELDLEQYDYSVGSKSLIRATEGTILDRLPPRIRIRENAPLELPHILVLINDPKCTVIEPSAGSGKILYDTPLNENGGHIRGYSVEQPNNVIAALEKLKSQCKDNLLYAMGDGNHSLATAKVCWEQLKSQGAPAEHPARYALVELVNLHSPALVFEPIHRVLFDTSIEQLLSYANENNIPVSKTDSNPHSTQTVQVMDKNGAYYLTLERPTSALLVGSLQNLLDGYIKAHNATVDYIHGEEDVLRLSKQNHLGFLLPAMGKSMLFPSVIADGALPRKTFSMGEAHEKRYYMEARAIA